MLPNPSPDRRGALKRPGQRQSKPSANSESTRGALAFALSRLAEHPETPTPVGVFRAVDRPAYGVAMQQQIASASEKSGPGDLAALLRSAPTWTVQ